MCSGDGQQQKGVRVQIKLPAEAAERLRQLAESNDPNLAAMGISGVMLGEGGSIIPISGADGSGDVDKTVFGVDW